jgi:polar amino acid transport system substrate-binding protein
MRIRSILKVAVAIASLWMPQVQAQPVLDPPLRIFTEDRPPFNYIANDGELTGVSTEIIRAALKHAEINTPIEVFPWARSFYLAVHRPNSLIFTIVRSPDREGKFLWVGELMPLDDWFYRAGGRNDVNPGSFADVLSCCQICVVNKDISEEILQRSGAVRGKNYIVADSFMDCARLVDSRNVELLVDSHFDTDGAVEKKLHHSTIALEGVLPVPIPAGVHEIAYIAANPKTSPEIIERLRQALLQMQASGETDRIKQNFFDRFKRMPAPVSP